MVAIALFVRDLRDDSRQQNCLAGVQLTSFRSAEFAEDDFLEGVRACGYEVPGDDTGDESDDETD